jgi:outer membrane protein assembly factor BamB
MLRALYCSILAPLLICVPSQANEWPSWRGPEQTGMSREKATVLKWSEEGENLLWRAPIGARNTPVVMNGRVFTTGPVGEGQCLGERVVCMNADTGELIWEKRLSVFQTDVVENRVGWTSLVGDPETGNVYVHGTGGELTCFSRDGKRLWSWSLGEEFGRYSGYGGRLHNPIVDEDRVIISFTYLLAQWGTGPKKAGHRYYAFDKRTGEVLWWAQPGEQPQDTTYATPAVAVIGGKRLLIAPNADGSVYGLLSRTGEKVWGIPFSGGALDTSPVVDGSLVYVTTGEENPESSTMGCVMCFDASKIDAEGKPAVVWRREGLEVPYASPALANGRLYVVTKSATLHALDAKTGATKWTHDLGTVVKGSPAVSADGVVYVGEVNGRFHILKDAGDKCEVLDFKEFSRPDKAVVEVNGSPALVNGRVYFFTRYDTFCLGKKGAAAETVSVPPLPAETPAAEGTKTSVLLVPGEVTLSPGDTVSFKARKFDANGRLLSTADVKDLKGTPTPELVVAGVSGEASPAGSFTASNAQAWSAGTVSLKLPDAQASARVRIVPKLPVDEKFDTLKAGEPPPGWIGADAKAKIVERDGGSVFQKLAERPSAPYCRMFAFSHPPLPAGYTVEADVMGETPEGRDTLSDMGVINSRYEFVFLGSEQVVRLVTWAPIPRIEKDVPFPWKPGVWYRMKLSVDVKDGKGLVRAKAWPRGEAEPAAWAVEVTDSCPNLDGSPGLYAYTKGATPKRQGAPSFFDNYRVYRND